MSTFSSREVTADPIARVGLSRRTAIGLAAVVGMGVGVSSPAAADPGPACSGDPVRAVAFDAFTVFDRQPVTDAAEEVFPGSGAALTDAWSVRQFEYTWLRTLSRTYTDFWMVTQDALDFAADTAGLELTTAGRQRLMAAWLELRAWPEAPAALRELKARGLRLALLSNATPVMLDSWVQNSGLQGVFDPHLSTDRVQAFKPDPRAYRMGVTAFGVPRAQIVFSAHGGWDAVGASVYGYRTFWVNRTGSPAERLGVTPEGSGVELNALVAFIGQRQ
jgi:2-haloacid dehalogenase